MEAVLDSRIGALVLAPLVLILLLTSVLRTYASQWLQPKRKPAKEAVQLGQQTLYLQLFQRNWSFLPQRAATRQRSKLMTEFEKRLHLSPEEAKRRQEEEQDMSAQLAKAFGGGANPGDQMQMFDGMKGQIAMVLSNVATYAIISQLFAGIVAGKLPFSLLDKFRPMTQRGVDLPGLEISYVTSLSLYVLVMVGVGGCVALLLGGQNDTAMMTRAMAAPLPGMGMPGQPGAKDPQAVLKAECDNLHTISYRNAVSVCHRNWFSPQSWLAVGSSAASSSISSSVSPASAIAGPPSSSSSSSSSSSAAAGGLAASSGSGAAAGDGDVVEMDESGSRRSNAKLDQLRDRMSKQRRR